MEVGGPGVPPGGKAVPSGPVGLVGATIPHNA